MEIKAELFLTDGGSNCYEEVVLTDDDLQQLAVLKLYREKYGLGVHVRDVTLEITKAT